MRTTCSDIALGLCLLVWGCDRTPLSPTCSYRGETYKPGETFSAGDACNRCSCGADGIAQCTEIRCPTDGRLPTDGPLPKDGVPGRDGPRGDGPARDTPPGICVNWQDMGIDCCDVCTAIYVTCKSSVTDKQKKPLSGQECLAACNPAGLAYNFYQCMAWKVSCDAAKLQECFDKTQP